MLSVSTMALAAMLGTSCPTNTANICQNSNLYQNPNCTQYQNCVKGRQELCDVLKGMGVCLNGNASCNGGSSCRP